MTKETEAKTEPRKWKIEGEAFDKINEIITRKEQKTTEAKAIHEELWEAIHAHIGDSDFANQHSIDATHRDIGILVVRENEDCCDNPLHRILAALKKSGVPVESIEVDVEAA